MGLSLIINDPTDEQIAKIRKIVDGTDATLGSESTPEPAKGKADKKSKKDKSEVIDTTGTDADAPVEQYTEKKLAKKERAELVSIGEAMGISDGDMKGKRVGTLVGLILDKQKAIANAGAEGDDDDFKADDDADEWNEDVPPADDDAPKKAKKDKGGKDKKKGKKKK